MVTTTTTIRHFVELTYTPTGAKRVCYMTSKSYTDPQLMANRLNGLKYFFAVDILRKSDPYLSSSELGDLAVFRGMPDKITHRLFDKAETKTVDNRVVKLTYTPTGATYVRTMSFCSGADQKAVDHQLMAIKLTFAADLLAAKYPDICFYDRYDLPEAHEMVKSITHEFLSQKACNMSPHMR